MCDLEISIQDVFVGLSSLNVGKASGIDNISPIVLKSCATALCGPIHHLFVQGISQAYISQECKTHYVTPIYKSGDKASVKNYRHNFSPPYVRVEVSSPRDFPCGRVTIYKLVLVGTPQSTK